MGNSNDRRRLERLERLQEASEEEEAWGGWNPDDLAILEEAEDMIGGPDDSGPPRGPEFFELAISRALEKRGRTTKEIAKELDRWLQDFEEAGGGGHT
jgi:hypothetical protein